MQYLRNMIVFAIFMIIRWTSSISFKRNDERSEKLQRKYSVCNNLKRVNKSQIFYLKSKRELDVDMGRRNLCWISYWGVCLSLSEPSVRSKEVDGNFIVVIALQ